MPAAFIASYACWRKFRVQLNDGLLLYTSLAFGMTLRISLTMPPIWAIWGFSVSIHSRSAPFCSAVTQSSTQRASPVPARNWNRLLGRRLGRSSLPSRLMMTSPLPSWSADSSSQSRKELYWSPRSPGVWVTAICLVRPAPSESVRATMMPSSTPSSRKA
ncbi:hypothetical protein D9M72_475860 [compost metagenome]